MKIVLAFDSFKGALTAREACEIARDGIRSVDATAVTIARPMADGGEGTAAVLQTALGGQWIPVTVTGPLPSMSVTAGFLWVAKTRLAVVEMAAASGLPLLRPEQYNPLETTTYGTGELIQAATDMGARKILLAVGGSATVDGGVGAAQALGWRFGPAGEIIPPQNIAMPELDVLCDVTNPLCGPNGAAQVYGPQKGATPAMVEQLDARLEHLAVSVARALGKEIRDLPGAGAAGGLAGGAVAFMNGRLTRGIDTVMQWTGLDAALTNADWVLTGEGCFDAPSLQGKVVDGVCRAARHAGTALGVIAGSVRLAESAWRAAGIRYVAALRRKEMSVEESIRRGRELLFEEAATFAKQTRPQANGDKI